MDEKNTFEKIDENYEGEKQEKVLILHGFSNKQTHEFIRHYKAHKDLPKVIFASTTSTSENMKVKELIKELVKEHSEIKSKS